MTKRNFHGKPKKKTGGGNPNDMLAQVQKMQQEMAAAQTALENGYVYDEPGEGTNDRVAISGDYALVVNPHVGYVSLLRRYAEPEAEPQDAEQVASAPVQAGPEVLVSRAGGHWGSGDQPANASVKIAVGKGAEGLVAMAELRAAGKLPQP